jgi:hypothetical protein
MQHPVYNVRYSAVQINSFLLNPSLYSSVRTTVAGNDATYQSFHDVVTELWTYIRITDRKLEAVRLLITRAELVLFKWS